MTTRKAYDRQRRAENPARKLYKAARWQKKRKRQLAEKPCCERCLKAGRVVAARDVHHLERHNGDPVIFWRSPLESLCTSCHSADAQFEEIHGYRTDIGNDGWPTDPRHPANR